MSIRTESYYIKLRGVRTLLTLGVVIIERSFYFVRYAIKWAEKESNLSRSDRSIFLQKILITILASALIIYTILTLVSTRI